MREIMFHGGDIYRNKVDIDFSINVNPCGMPEGVRQACIKAVDECEAYPDIMAEELGTALAKKYGVERANVVLGNGASELIMAVVNAFRPKKVLLPVPSFGGYRYALGKNGVEVVYHKLDAEKNFANYEELIDKLDDGVELLILTNPNNPTGSYIDRAILEAVLNKCRDRDIKVLLDECFIELSDEGPENTFSRRLTEYPNLLILNAFTKSYAIPGIRLGYILGSDIIKMIKIGEHLPEWNISTIAQKAGLAALKEKDYLSRSLTLIKEERIYLEKAIAELGIKVYPGKANYVFFYLETKYSLKLDTMLLERGILIRNCRDYVNLKDGYYRVAVRKHEDNVKLIEAMRDIIEKRG